ncbi:hypothetical protein EST38_g5624 [Candolleomyces aberdarensis]|uniref:Sof1-like protein domain-containing protein n=1 Tax=Candolleomyces aberdarensis TaxID=2316362 RepID=A0A4V1Q3Y7_9AGAR|nr:hypothetical protein EST38_g5624 [Candolleomyces aberdarensis]
MSSSDWSFNLRSNTSAYFDSSSSESDSDEPTKANSLGDALNSSKSVKATKRVSDDTDTAESFDLSSRNEEGVVYKPNPFSIAKINAACRAQKAQTDTAAPDITIRSAGSSADSAAVNGKRKIIKPATPRVAASVLSGVHEARKQPEELEPPSRRFKPPVPARQPVAGEKAASTRRLAQQMAGAPAAVVQPQRPGQYAPPAIVSNSELDVPVAVYSPAYQEQEREEAAFEESEVAHTTSLRAPETAELLPADSSASFKREFTPAPGYDTNLVSTSRAVADPRPPIRTPASAMTTRNSFSSPLRPAPRPPPGSHWPVQRASTPGRIRFLVVLLRLVALLEDLHGNLNLEGCQRLLTLTEGSLRMKRAVLQQAFANRQAARRFATPRFGTPTPAASRVPLENFLQVGQLITIGQILSSLLPLATSKFGMRPTPISNLTFPTSNETVSSVRFNLAEPSVLASVGSDRTFTLYDIRTGKAERRVVMQFRSNALSWPPTLPTMALLASEDHNLYTFDARHLAAPVQIYKGHVAAVMSCEWAPTGVEFVSGGWDRTVRIWSSREAGGKEKGPGGREVVYHTKRMQRVTSTIYSSDARYILSGSDDGNVIMRIWNAKASDKLGVITARERAAMEYRQSLTKRWSVDKDVGTWHLPKAVYKASQLKTAMLDARRVKEDRRRKDTRAGESKPVAEKKKVIFAERS